jgi:aminoglycoside phosphotransferase (APT) family kinase protein
MTQAGPEAQQRIAEGREAEIYRACGDWPSNAVVRLLRDPLAAAQVEWEATAMIAARSCGIPVPAVYGTTTALGRPGLVMEWVDGRDLFALLGERPWLVLGIGRRLGEVHAALHDVEAPATLPPLRAILGEQIAAARLPGRLADFALAALDRLPDGERLCHGDFHPANVLMTRAGPVLIDWTGAARGDAAADVARSCLLWRLGSLAPGAPPVLRVLAPFGRRLLIAAYVRGYRRRRPIDQEHVARWQIPRAAARLADGIPEEEAALVRLLERALRRRAAG